MIRRRSMALKVCQCVRPTALWPRLAAWRRAERRTAKQRTIEWRTAEQQTAERRRAEQRTAEQQTAVGRSATTNITPAAQAGGRRPPGRPVTASLGTWADSCQIINCTCLFLSKTAITLSGALGQSRLRGQSRRLTSVLTPGYSMKLYLFLHINSL